jgi:hypothetical protein
MVAALSGIAAAIGMVGTLGILMWQARGARGVLPETRKSAGAAVDSAEAAIHSSGRILDAS